jgi:16S rRNA C967 or C1407 C5-methylase (RsmB/RsmF family)
VRKKDGLLNVDRFYPESFDRILLDPPCSALGLRPKLQVVQTTLDDLKGFANYQRRFVKQAVALLKPGGTMTYSTCTIHSLENEAMVSHIINEYPMMELVPIDIDLGLPGLGGLGLDARECSFVRRFHPADQADTMGFFIAKFQKRHQPK